MALRQPRHGLSEPTYLHISDDRFGNLGRGLILHDTPQFGGVFPRAEWLVEARGIGHGALNLPYLLGRPPEAPRDLFVGRLAAQLGGEPIVGAGHLAHLFTHVHGEPYGAALVRHGPSDSLPHPPRGVVGEPEAPVWVELLDGLHQPYVALLNEVLKGHPTTPVLLGHAHHEPQVLLDEPHVRLGVPSLSPLGELHLLRVSQQRAFVDASEIARNKVRRLCLPGVDASLNVMHPLASLFVRCSLLDSRKRPLPRLLPGSPQPLSVLPGVAVAARTPTTQDRPHFPCSRMSTSALLREVLLNRYPIQIRRRVGIFGSSSSIITPQVGLRAHLPPLWCVTVMGKGEHTACRPGFILALPSCACWCSGELGVELNH